MSMARLESRPTGMPFDGRGVSWAGGKLSKEVGGPERPFVPRARPLSPRESVGVRQAALVDFLDQLCTDDSVEIASDKIAARYYFRFFRSLYLDGNEFRHSYSEVCRLVYDKVSPYESDGRLLSSVPPELDNLRHNLDAIIASLNALRTHMRRRLRDIESRPDFGDTTATRETRSEDDLRQDEEILRKDFEEIGEVIKRVTKLYDHVSMEIERLGYMVRQNKCNSDAILEASRIVDDAVAKKEKQLKDLSNEIERTKRDVQRDNIAVLGIFAAVVLVVNSAVGFSASSLEAIGAGRGVVPVLLMAAIVGFVMINTVCVLLSYIWNMTIEDGPQRDDRSKNSCESESSEGQGAGLGSRIIRRVLPKLEAQKDGRGYQLDGWPKCAWVVTNLVLIAIIILLALTRLPWFRGLVGLSLVG